MELELSYMGAAHLFNLRGNVLPGIEPIVSMEDRLCVCCFSACLFPSLGTIDIWGQMILYLAECLLLDPELHACCVSTEC